MRDKIYVLIDHANGKIRNPSLESLVLGQKLGAEMGSSVHAVILGKNLDSLVTQLTQYQMDSVVVLENERLAEYSPDLYCAALTQLLEKDQPRLFLLAHIYQNIDMAPKLAARMKKGLITDCIGYKIKEEDLFFVRQMFRSKLDADIRIQADPPWMVTLQAGAFSSDELQAGSAEVSRETVELEGVQNRRKSLEAVETAKGQVDLTKADVIVAVGRGIKKQENMALIEELARILGAEIGASRPVVDNEWLGRARQIGSSGQNVSPRLYFAVGISGAIQHVVGMKGSGTIVAINSDPNAPIFNVATYGIVGDLFEIVPALTQKLREEKGT